MGRIGTGHDAAPQRAMALTAALMFFCALIVFLIESLIGGGQSSSPLPGVASLIFATLLALFGSRLPRPALALLGPIGVAMIAGALATTKGATDTALLYVWPVLWQSYFFGRRGTIAIIACVALADGGALLSMPHHQANVDRWIDVMCAVGVVGVVVEMLAARNLRLIERSSEEARIDDLTQLLNRRGFEEGADRELSRAARERTWIGVVAFDLDHFKRVNDEFGHVVGDRVLARFAGCLRASARGTDVVARTGGEEFVALLPGAGLERARLFAERVHLTLRAAPSSDHQLPAVTVSAGAAAGFAPDTIEALLKRADAALYEAKAAGRDRTVVDSQRTVTGSLAGLQVREHGEDPSVVA